MADIKQIAEKVNGAKNILVALSKNPDVDEVSAALGLTLMLDKLGKKATAIYSGKTPDALRFLSPEKTFSSDTNALQDFIISLDKDKADHLRYKVDGDYVKVFITPYREAISENDLEYSYGDFNVDLIVALGVAEESDLDGALVEYGRIMHDAGVVNITTKEGGKFSEVEWSNPSASSVSEMVAELGTELEGEAFEKDSATALLTGIVASTERFAKENTTPETMGVASKLMAAGADQSLIAENIERAEAGKEPIMMESLKMEAPAAESVEENTSVEESKIEESTVEAPEISENEPKGEEPVVETPEVAEPEKSDDEPQKPVLETPSELLGDMPKTEESPVEEAEPEASEAPIEEPVAPEALAEEPEASASEAPAPEVSDPEAKPEEEPTEEPKVEETPAEEPKPEEAPTEEPKVETPELPKATGPAPEDTTHKSVKLQPSAEAQAELEQLMKEEPKKNELLEELNRESEKLASKGLRPDVGLSSIDTDSIGKTEVKDYSQMMAAALDGDGGMPNPAVQATPAVMAGPEENHIPEIDYSQPSAVEAEQPPVMQNGMLEPVAPAVESAGAAHEGMMAATDRPVDQAPGMVAAHEGMNEDILPPPPAPPVNGGMMPPTEMTAPAVEPVQPAPVVSAQPVVTAPQAAPVAPVVPAAPEAPAAPATPATPEMPTQVGPTPTTDDPSAFRIPGM